MIHLKINNTFNKELPADPITENYIRKVMKSCFSFVKPTIPKEPKLLHYSADVLNQLGLTQDDVTQVDFLDVVSGTNIYPNTQSYAMCYGGHQFGNWAGQLGDGRAINLFEIEHNQKQWAVQLKGSGKTPYSRGADGLAVLRSSIREYLCSEAMHYLGVPTTRALSLVITGDMVLRDVMYNGNSAYESGAIVCRVAPSFIRFGNFQLPASHDDIETLKKLTDYTISHFYKNINLTDGVNAYVEFFKSVTEKTLHLMLEWQRVGFVHGVMNTDNLSILGLTIDYGPYGWLEDYNPDWTPNTTDFEHKRYRFGNQANIGLWNLVQLANALYPLINDVKPLEEILKSYEENYIKHHTKMMLQKLGLITNTNETKILIDILMQLLIDSEMDMTIFYRNLSQFNGDNLQEQITLIECASYSKDFTQQTNNWETWLNNYGTLIITENNSTRVETMNTTNPKYVLRNYMAQLAIEAADKNDFSILNELFELLKQPYAEQPEKEKWFAKRPDWAINKIGCSQLSCSS